MRSRGSDKGVVTRYDQLRRYRRWSIVLDANMTATKTRRLRELLEPDASQDLVVALGLQNDGATYRLHPTSTARIREVFPEVRVAPSVYVGYATRADFEALHGPIWPQIVILLTGLDEEKLKAKFHRLVLWDPVSGQQWENDKGVLRVVN